MAIGNLDAAITFVDPIASRQTFLQLQNNWSRIVIEQDALSYHKPENLAISKQQLTAAGLYGIANSLSQNDSIAYECAWRLCDWSVLDETINRHVEQQSPNFENLFEKNHYQALKSLQIKDEMGVKLAIKNARLAIISHLKHASLECTNNIYSSLKNLALIQQIEDFSQVGFIIFIFYINTQDLFFLVIRFNSKRQIKQLTFLINGNYKI